MQYAIFCSIQPDSCADGHVPLHYHYHDAIDGDDDLDKNGKHMRDMLAIENPPWPRIDAIYMFNDLEHKGDVMQLIQNARIHGVNPFSTPFETPHRDVVVK